MVPISRLPVLAAPRGNRSNAGTCTESDIVNVSSNVNPTTNAEENNNDSDQGEDNNISCLENKIIDEDNSSNLDSIWGLDNDKTLNILEQEKNDFWSPPHYILYWYKKISNIQLKDDILIESLWSSIK